MLLVMRYPGGKGHCYQRLISMMPPHRIYIETHLGGGAVLRNKRPAVASFGIERDERVVERWQAMKTADTTIVQGDALDFLRGYAFTGEELVYCDPPYPKETRAKARLYRYEYTHDDHVRLLACLRRLPCMVIVSSYDNKLYVETLHDWRVVRFPGASHCGPRIETAWLNFPQPAVLHDFSHAGEDFRDRERVRRRRAGLSHRIDALQPVERNALFRELASRYRSDLRAAADLEP